MSKLNKLIENAIKAAAIPVRESKSQQIIRRLKEDTAYQEFFRKALEKYGVNSPADFDSDEKKKEFFNYVDKNYSAKTEGKLREEYFPTHGADSPDVKKTKAALANWFKNTMRNPNTPSGQASAGTLNKQQLDNLHDLIDDYALAYAEDEIAAAEKVMSRR
jgi:hypothetical protein